MGSKVKSRMTVFDVSRMTHSLRHVLLSQSMWLHNIYDTDLTTKKGNKAKSLILKLSAPGSDKRFLIINPGQSFFLTESSSFANNDIVMPSGFAMKLRKHLRGKKLVDISQMGFDRLIVLTFSKLHMKSDQPEFDLNNQLNDEPNEESGNDSLTYYLIIELYASGNVILTDSEFIILAALRSHDFGATVDENNIQENEEAKIAVRQKFPFQVAVAELPEIRPSDELRNHLLFVSEALKKEHESNKNKEIAIPLREVFAHKSCEYSGFGKDILLHFLLLHELNPDENSLDQVDFLKIHSALVDARNLLIASQKGQLPDEGYIICKGEFYESFEAFKLSQYLDREIKVFRTFWEAVDEFFASLEKQKLLKQEDFLQAQAMKKVEKVKQEQEKRLDDLSSTIEQNNLYADSILKYNDIVDKALLVINSALANQMSWEELETLIAAEKANGNFVAKIIHSLELKSNEINLILESMVIKVSLGLSAHANAAKYFEQRKKTEQKVEKTMEVANKLVESAEKKAISHLHQQVALLEKKKLGMEIGKKTIWFERFFWFFTKKGYLILAGRDAQQNELLVKKYLRYDFGDLFLHADIPGASTCVLRNLKGNKDIDEVTLREAASFAVCRSKAWDLKTVCNAYYVTADQVSKSAPSGEYLTIGSFMVRGKKTFVPDIKMELGFGMLFKLDETQPGFNERKPDWNVQPNSEDNTEGNKNFHEDTENDLLDKDEIYNGKTEDDNEKDEASNPNLEAESLSLDDSGNNSMLKAKGPLTAKERRDIKKHGKIFDKGVKLALDPSKEEVKSNTKSIILDVNNNKRGKKSKLKKMKTKYRHQTEEDRLNALKHIGHQLPVLEEKIETSDESEAEEDNQDSLHAPAQSNEPKPNRHVVDLDSIEKINSDVNLKGFTCNPKPGDVVLYAIPFCGPLTSMSNFKYKVKIVPGTMKRGKAVKVAIDLLIKSSTNARESGLIKALDETPCIQVMPGNVKISAPGANKLLAKVNKKK